MSEAGADRAKGFIDTAVRTADLALLEMDFARGGPEALMVIGEALKASRMALYEAEELPSEVSERAFSPALVWSSGAEGGRSEWRRLEGAAALKIAEELAESASMSVSGTLGDALFAPDSGRAKRLLPLRVQGKLAGFLAIVFAAAPGGISETALASFALSLSAALARHRSEKAIACARAEEEAARRASALLLARAGHELKTPLVALDGIAALLEEKIDTMDPQRRREAVGYVRQGGRRLLRLVEEVLALARMDAGLRPAAREPVDLGAILAYAESFMAGLLNGKATKFAAAIEPGIPGTILGDRDAIVQILENLLGNAAKFTGSGAIELRISRCAMSEFADAIAFSVSDEGLGMDAATLAAIAEPFHATRQGLSGERGSGLGLTIVASLARLIGGRFSIESEKGAGTVARLMLPLQPPRAHGFG